MTSPRLLHQAVDQAADRDGDAIAFEFGAQSLTYAELSARSDRLAAVLIDQGVRRGDRVALYLNKSIETPVALFGAMKAGAAYVPIDPGAPTPRARAVLAQCDVKAIVTHPPKAEQLTEMLAASDATEPLAVGAIIGVDAPLAGESAAASPTVSWNDVDTAPLGRTTRVIEQDVAYIIFTSGSTGAPKGITHTHQSGMTYAQAAADLYDVRPGDRLSNHSPLHFDMSTFDYFCPALAGARTVIIPEPYAKLPASLAQLIEKRRLTHWYSVPFALIQLLERGGIETKDLSSIRWVLFGGEPFPAKQLRSLLALWPQARFANVYGPAEVNQCMHHEVVADDLADDKPPPIGRMWAPAEGLIVDDHDAPVDPGEPGELLVRASTMMRGYWERPDLNAKAFYERAVTADISDRFYRTGDIVEEGPGGVMRFAGRRDRQVKVRGFRVELDEVEAALAISESVDEAAAIVVPSAQGVDEIVGAATLRTRAVETTPEALIELAAARLPPYATPSRVVILETFPRTTSGKIDRRALAVSLAASDDVKRSTPS